MAVIHISEAAAAKDFPALMEKVRGGAEVVIENDAIPVAVLHAPVAKEHVRRLSESLRMAKERASTATLDGEFERDLAEIVKSHSQPLRDPWE